MRHVAATRYVAPLREGGSLPGLVEADDDGLYVVKFRGAGQGPLALVAEVIGGELARALGLPVPELVLIDIDPRLAAAEPDPDIQDLIAASAGVNLGVDFLPGSLPLSGDVDAQLAADVVWFDELITNVDRTPRNPNLLRWHGSPWLIDHGAAFYAQHSADDFVAAADKPFPLIEQHVLLPAVGDARPRLAVDRDMVEAVVADVPQDWLVRHPRESYVEHLLKRAAR
jgi:hypothetical protein